MDLKELLNKEMEKIDLEGLLREEIGKELKSLLSKVVKEQFSHYGPIGKQLTTHFNEKLKLDLESVKVEDHASFVTGCIVKQLAEAFKCEEAAIKSLVDENIFTETRTEIPMTVFETEITDLILEDFHIEREQFESDCCDLTIDIDREKEEMSYGNSHYERIKIAINKDSKKQDYTMGLHNDVIYYHHGTLDCIDAFCKVLKFRGTKIKED